MTDEEYEHKKGLLEKWEEREREQFRKKIISETVSHVVDATGIGDKIASVISNTVKNKK